MRDAFGGLFMIRVLLVFLLVFITFVAVAFNYARAFRVKNKIIDVIEQNEGYNFINTDVGSSRNLIEGYLKEVGYTVNKDIALKYCDKDYIDHGNYGYCVQEISSGDENYKYYQVKTFVVLSFPFLEDFSITIPISGETKTIFNFPTSG